MQVTDYKLPGGGLKWAKVQAFEWDDAIQQMFDDNVGVDKLGWIGLAITMTASNDVDDMEMADLVKGHIMLLNSAAAEYREMGKMYKTWPWVSCLLVNEQSVPKKDFCNKLYLVCKFVGEGRSL